MLTESEVNTRLDTLLSMSRESETVEFKCPFIFAVDKAYSKIRNLKYRYINPEFQTLFPEEIAYLRKQRLVEGRLPNLYISKGVAQATEKITYSKHKGLEIKACEELLLGSLRDHKALSKPEVVELLWNVLPDVFSDDQKRVRIKNLLYKLKKLGKIYCITKGRDSNWYINE